MARSGEAQDGAIVGRSRQVTVLDEQVVRIGKAGGEHRCLMLGVGDLSTRVGDDLMQVDGEKQSRAMPVDSLQLLAEGSLIQPAGARVGEKRTYCSPTTAMASCVVDARAACNSSSPRTRKLKVLPASIPRLVNSLLRNCFSPAFLMGAMITALFSPPRLPPKPESTI